MSVPRALANQLSVELGAVPAIPSRALSQMIRYHGEASGADRTASDAALNDWEEAYCAPLDREALFELITACNYAGYLPLLNLTCRRVAAMLKGRSPQEMAALMGIKKDEEGEGEEDEECQ
jgi:hypothetical protein